MGSNFRKVAKAALIATALCFPHVSSAADAVSPRLDQAGYALVPTSTVKSDTKEKFAEAMRANTAASRQEPGVLLYRAYQSSSNPLVFVNVDLHKDKAAFDAHLKAPHVLKVSEVFKEILAKDIEVVFLSPLP